MTLHGDMPAPTPVAGNLDRLSDEASRLGHDVVEIAGNLDTAAAQSRAQLDQLKQARTAADALGRATAALQTATARVDAASSTAAGETDTSVGLIRASVDQSTEVAAWVARLAQRLREVEETLKAVTVANARIGSISEQVRFLAINARIEAARAGAAGRGFGVVAEAINELSHQTAEAAQGVSASIDGLQAWTATLVREAGTVAPQAQALSDGATATDSALIRLARSVAEARAGAEAAVGAVGEVEHAVGTFRPLFDGMGRAVEDGAGALAQASRRAEALVDRSERMVQACVAAGGSSGDAPFIARVQADAARIARSFEDALDTGAITLEGLFSTDYRPIPGTDPPQLMAPFTELTDRLLPAVQERALEFDDRVVFCAAVDRNGYLPTHNRKFSHPQTQDPVWNAAHCRNRRVFDDRVGLKAGRNTEPFLLQTYRRDMGGGEFRMMKDLSAPIRVKGRHWGGLRLAYAF